MINIISSTASAPNTLLHEVPRREQEDNLRWLSRQPRPGADQTGIVLVGGTECDLVSFTGGTVACQA